MHKPGVIRVDRLVHLGILITSAVLASSKPDEVDLWSCLRFGKSMVTRPDAAPKSDPPAQSSWIGSPEWLLDLGLYGVYRSVGVPGLRVFRMLMAVAAVYVLSRRWQPSLAEPCDTNGENSPGADFWPAILALPAICLGQQFLADSVTVLFSLVWFRVLDSRHQLGSWQWAKWLLPLQVIWANMDSRFLLGPILALVWCLGAWPARLNHVDEAASGAKYKDGRSRSTRIVADLAAVGLLLVASIFNPRGIDSLWVSARMLVPTFSLPVEGLRLVTILEATLESPALDAKIVWLLLVALSVASFGVVWRSPSPARALVLATSIFWGLLTVRDAALAATIAAAVTIANLRDARRRREVEVSDDDALKSAGTTWRVAAGRLARVASVAGLILLLAAWYRNATSSRLETTTVRASDMTESGPVLAGLGWRGNLIGTDIEHLGQAAWFCGVNSSAPISPRLAEWDERIIDVSRMVEDVREGRFSDYLREDGSVGGWRKAFDERAIELLVISAARRSTYRLMRSNPYWGVVYRDDRVIVLGRVNVAQFAKPMSATADSLRELEWPNGRPEGQPPAVVGWRRWAVGTLARQGAERDMDGARSLVDLGFPLAAIRQVRWHMRIHPAEPRAFLALAEANLSMAGREQLDGGHATWLRHVMATAFLQQAIDLGDASIETRQRLVELRARDDFNPVPDSLVPEEELRRATRLFEDGRPKQAVELLQSRGWPEPHDGQAKTLLGVAALIEGEYRDAIELWDQAELRRESDRFWPSLAELCYWRGLASAELGDRGAARRWMAQALAHVESPSRLANVVQAFLAAIPEGP